MKIITHSGPFHCDDVFACAMLMAHAPRWVEIVRTRDASVISAGVAEGCFVVDVGGVYDLATRQLDHHLLPAPCRKDGTKLASAGMVLESLTSTDDIVFKGYYAPSSLEEVVRKVDAADNAVKVDGWSLSETVHKCNPVGVAATPEEFDRRFRRLVEVIALYVPGLALGRAIDADKFVYAVSNNREVVGWVAEHDAAMAASEARIRHAFGQPGSNLVLKEYEVALFKVAAEAPAEKLYSLYPSPGGEWMVQQIPTSPGAFAGRKPLPAAWAGKRGTDLDAVTGVEGGVFVHPDRFIGGHKTLEGALRLADLAAAE